MKTMEWVIAAGLVLLAWKMWNGKAQAATPKSGWQNFPGGVSIDPQGNYYLDGKPVWTTAMGG